jgi:hypothetical protein
MGHLSSSVFWGQSAILIGPSDKKERGKKTKTETLEAPKNSNFYVRKEYLPFGHTKGENFGQRIRDKMRCYWEHP